MNPVISIIIPIYNAEDYLSRSIDSVLRQTFSDFELLLIDDGSCDNSSEICDEYIQKDKRVHCFHLENGGVSRARNYGLEHSQGDFITFLDADDWFEADHLAQLIKLQRKNDADVVAAGCVFKYPDSSSRNSDWYTQEVCSCLGEKEIFKRLKSNECLSYCVWDKLYRHKLLFDNDVYFEPSVSIGEDSLFSYVAIANAEKIEIDFTLSTYCYYIHEKSVMHQSDSKKLLDDLLKTFFVLNEYRKSGKISLKYYKHCFLLKISSLYEILFHREKNKKTTRQIIEKCIPLILSGNFTFYKMRLLLVLRVTKQNLFLGKCLFYLVKRLNWCL